MPELMPIFMDTLSEGDPHVREGVCIGLAELINATTKESRPNLRFANIKTGLKIDRFSWVFMHFHGFTFNLTLKCIENRPF